ncbi:MAG: winged helix-turn-helix transcriptional regulator [Candidatus Heimdallarchaeum aukensis]|uniref:Winged helix-turn-helix transcriptional regulator n=1 Tax=Candidatus Heimdallarchaeum aukensis TaxID=2876573 RepID=A0A9Y1BLK7_9ARCH|nr:MAG: winged helix-turn-helix transcriptional regulator [Candidatus Heimdallarchaeum aukensis]
MKKIYRIPLLQVKIIHALQDNPLASYEEIAKKVKIPLTTLYRKIRSLEEKKIIRNTLSSKIAEKIGLTRYTFEFKIKSLEQFQLMQLAFHEHPFTYHYNRFYGNQFGFYAKFDIPEGGIKYFELFLKELINREMCESYNLYASTGHWVDIQEPIPNTKLNPKSFNLVEFWGKRQEMKETNGEKIEKIDIKKLHPIQLLILRDINRNAKQKQKDLLELYKKALENEKVNSEETKIIPEAYKSFIEEFFEGRSHEAIMMDFNRKYKFVFENLVTNFRINFSRNYFEIYPMQAYVIKDISSEESFQTLNLFKKYRPPFRAGIDILNRGLFIAVTLPPFYASRFSYLIYSSYSDFKFYNMDFFGEHGVAYPFYVNNFDPIKNEWKTDKKWIVDDVFSRIDGKLNNGNYGENNNHH